jgi:hypothetical protein
MGGAHSDRDVADGANRRLARDVGAPHMLLWCAAIRNDRLKTAAIRARDVNDDSCSHQ